MAAVVLAEVEAVVASVGTGTNVQDWAGDGSQSHRAAPHPRSAAHIGVNVAESSARQGELDKLEELEDSVMRTGDDASEATEPPFIAFIASEVTLESIASKRHVNKAGSVEAQSTVVIASPR